MKPDDVPDFHDWFLAQTHRDDLVGALARSYVGMEAGKAGFEAWLAETEAGIVVRSVIDDARREYATCLQELRTEGHSDGFPLMCRVFDPDAQCASWARHKAEPEKSVETYLHELHKGLRKQVEAQMRLYLDTGHWIRLLNVETGRSPARAEFKDDTTTQGRT